MIHLLTNIISDPDERDDCPIGIDIVLSNLNLCSNELNFDVSEFFAFRGIDSGDASLTCDDVALHFMNGQCASRNVPVPTGLNKGGTKNKAITGRRYSTTARCNPDPEIEGQIQRFVTAIKSRHARRNTYRR